MEQPTLRTWTPKPLLTSAWSLGTLEGVTVAVLASVLLAVIYEGSKFYYHIGKAVRPKLDVVRRFQGGRLAHYVSRMWKSLAYTVHFFIGYVLMLFSMTFNLWVLVSICLGSAIGYFFLLPLIQHVVLHLYRPRDAITSASEHCPRKTDSDPTNTEETDPLRQLPETVPEVNMSGETIL